DPISYDGPIWKLDRAILALEPYQNRPPQMLVAGGAGKALRFAGQLADGWVCYAPAVGTPEMYAEEVQQLRRHAEEAGRDPDALQIVERTPPEAVRATRVTGTPAEAAEQILPYIEAGATDVMIANYLPLIMSGDFSDALQGTSQVLETVKILRQKTG